MFERSEFLSSRKMSAERRGPEGQGVGAPFLCFLSWGEQREEVVVWGRNPKVLVNSMEFLQASAETAEPVVYRTA